MARWIGAAITTDGCTAHGEGLDAIVTMTINGASIATIAMTRDVHHDYDKRKMAGRWKLSGTCGT